MDFIKNIGNLKQTLRQGWTKYPQIKRVESVADHSFRIAMLAFMFSDDEVDRNKLIKMALVHDVAECIVGDITPDSGISKQEKHKMEKEAMIRLCEMLNGQAKLELMDLWLEYEQGESKEAIICKDLDKFEMLMQAKEYENGDPFLFEFFLQTPISKFKTKKVKKMLELI